MKYKASEILQFVEENDVKFIRLAFCDVYGHQKNIAIMPDELPRAFETGISFAASAVEGFMNVKESDLFLIPDPSTLTVLPWRPSHGRVVRFFCDIRHPDGTPFAGDGRQLLKQAVAELNALGLTCQVGTECEFYLFELDEKGNPTSIPQDRAGYCDIAPLDRGENVRREICLTLEEMGIKPESSHHEHGPGQNEVDFRYSDALTAADNVIHFESVVKTIANRNGLCASFMPKPLADAWGSGLHINLSLFRDGVNIFRTDGYSHNQEAESFIAGILDRICEITLFLNPITNSYRRLGNSEAARIYILVPSKSIAAHSNPCDSGREKPDGASITGSSLQSLFGLHPVDQGRIGRHSRTQEAASPLKSGFVYGQRGGTSDIAKAAQVFKRSAGRGGKEYISATGHAGENTIVLLEGQKGTVEAV